MKNSLSADGVDGCPTAAETLRLVLCRAGGVRLALDAQQVRAVRPYDPSQGRHPRFDELVPCPARPRAEENPILVAFAPDALLPGLVLSALDDVTDVHLRDVRALPPLVGRFAGGYGLWGMVLVDGRPRLLFDPTELAAPLPPVCPEEGESP